MASERLEVLKKKIEPPKPEADEKVEMPTVVEEEVAAPKVTADDLNREGVELVRGGKLVEALSIFGEALELEPSHRGARFNLAFAYQRLKRFDDAEREYRKVLETDDLARAHLMLGLIYEEKGEYEAALKEFEEVLRLEPDNENAKSKLDRLKEELKTSDELIKEGAEHLKAKRYAMAVEYFKRAVDKAPDDYRPHYNLGVAYLSMGSYSEAIEAFKRTLDINDMANAYFMMCIAYDKVGDGEKAKECFEKVLELDPDNAMAKKYLEK
jgi:tetratricopeptide (TPR) repeat protein